MLKKKAKNKKGDKYTLLFVATIFVFGAIFFFARNGWDTESEEEISGEKVVPVRIYSDLESTRVFLSGKYLGNTDSYDESGWYLEQSIPSGRYTLLCEGISERAVLIRSPLTVKC